VAIGKLICEPQFLWNRNGIKGCVHVRGEFGRRKRNFTILPEASLTYNTTPTNSSSSLVHTFTSTQASHHPHHTHTHTHTHKHTCCRD
jgi:hypothetical protein